MVVTVFDRDRIGDYQQMVAALRKAGDVVVIDLPGHEKSRSELGCNRKLMLRNGKWVVEKAGDR